MVGMTGRAIVLATVIATGAACAGEDEMSNVTTGAAPAVGVPAMSPTRDKAFDGLTSCTGGGVTRAELSGTWSESPVGSAYYTLDVVGSMTYTNSQGTVSIGRWQFVPWNMSPAPSSSTQSERWPCVLWIEEETPEVHSLPVLLVPIDVTETHADMVPVGRDEVVRWYRRIAR
ncbi:hypothetical protein JRC04_17120 [Mycolicibacterium sp. S2-37]|nr:hypothetical protein [Mycolicibacterium sp. S2-37]